MTHRNRLEKLRNGLYLAAFGPTESQTLIRDDNISSLTSNSISHSSKTPRSRDCSVFYNLENLRKSWGEFSLKYAI